MFIFRYSRASIRELAPRADTGLRHLGLGLGLGAVFLACSPASGPVMSNVGQSGSAGMSSGSSTGSSTSSGSSNVPASGASTGEALDAFAGGSSNVVEDARAAVTTQDVVAETEPTEAPSGDAPAASCVTAGTELCDGFETGNLDTKVWKINLLGPSPSVTVDSMHAHTGTYAAHARVMPGQQSTAQITEAVTFPALEDTFYTRIWAYFSPDVMWPNNPADFHTGFIIAGGNNDLGHVELAVGANLSPSSAAGPMHYLGYSIYRGPPYDEFGPRSPTVVTTSAWTCIELLESGQGGSAAVRRIWVDDKELPEQYSTFGVTSPNGQKPPAFDLVSIGIWEYHPTPSLSDMWIDDVRVSSQRIGCTN